MNVAAKFALLLTLYPRAIVSFQMTILYYWIISILSFLFFLFLREAGEVQDCLYFQSLQQLASNAS